MTTNLFISMLFLFVTYSLQAQKAEIIVKDSLSGNVIMDANITIEQIEVRNTIARVTDQFGKVVWHSNDFPLKVVLKISATGFQSFISDTLIVKENETLYYKLKEQSTILEEILIVDPRSLIYSQDKITYIPRKTVFDQTQSITELLPSIPGISKRNGSFFFRNESAFVVLIDGLGENKSKEEQLLILENMPVNSILKIEFIDQPSVRFGGNITGVINVITKKNLSYSVVKVGSTVQHFSSQGEMKYPLSLNGNFDSRFRVKKSNIHFALRSNNTRQQNSKYYNLMFRPYQDINQNSLSITQVATVYPYFSIDHSFNKRLSGQLSTYFSWNSRKEEGTSSYSFTSNNSVDSTFQTTDIGRNTNFRFVLTPQLKYIVDSVNNMTIYINSTLALMGDDYENDYKRIANPEELYARISSHTQIFYLDLIGENILNGKTGTLSAGVKFNFLKNSPRFGQNFQYKEFANNVFVSSQIQLSKIKIRSGLRAEILDFKNENNDLISKTNLINLFPSLNVLRQLGSEKNVSIGYNRNILRMASIAYNSQFIYKGYMNGIAGNNELKPRITNYIYLQFYLKSHVLSVNYKWHTNHRIFLPIDSMQPYMMRSATYNHLKQFYLNYNKDFQISKFWSSNLGVYGYYNRMNNRDLSFYNKQDLNYQLDLYNTFMIGTYKLEFGLNYNSPYKTEWGKLKPILYNSLVFNKVLKDKTWDVRLTINDLLGISKEGSAEHYPLMYRSEEQINHQRSIGVQLTYRFPFGKKTRLNKYQSDLKDEIRN